MEALKEFPKNDVKLQTEKGPAICQKIDIFKGLMWFSYVKEGMNWLELSVENVNKIVALNKKGTKVASLEEYVVEVQESKKELFSNVVGQDSLTRFDKPKGKKRNKRRKGRNKNRKRSKNRNSKKNA